MFIGRNGAGKSTLKENILADEQSEEWQVLSPGSGTQFRSTYQHGVSLKVYDTVGLEPDYSFR